MLPVTASRDWHAVLRQWSKPPSETEDQRASNAESMIRAAIRDADAFKGRSVDVYATGSYRNNTNARTESDVDVAIVLRDTVFYELGPGQTPEALGFSAASYPYDLFRDDVERALRAKFGSGVTPGDKAFDVHENSYRLDADVAVFLEHRRYTGAVGNDGAAKFFAGVEMRPRSNPNKRIINWHQQHYDNGVAKNNATGRRFKRITRILKRLRTEMSESSDATTRAATEGVASFLLESLAFKVPDSRFNQTAETYYEDTKAVVGWLWHRIHNNEHLEFKEVSEMKWLFRDSQPWTAAQAKSFLGKAWTHVGFGA